MNPSKTFSISKHSVLAAFKAVKANGGSAGIDHQSIEGFERNLKDNLYKIWNRMSSGSYFPPPVKAVPIPKKSGGERVLGIPTVSDRVAQIVVKLHFEPNVEPIFLTDSYGYRPGKSAIEAVGVTRKRCWYYDWVLEFDIKGLFDNIDHELMMKAVRLHTSEPWILLYLERWLKAPLQNADGSLIERTKGTPQGGVVSPVLSNLFLHYVFDVWMTRKFPKNPWCRYADDGLVHCKTKQQAEEILSFLRDRFVEFGLELHPLKTKIVYCKDQNRKGNHDENKFDFLGFTFRRRGAIDKLKRRFASFQPGASDTALRAMCDKIRKLKLRNRADLSIEQISKWFNPILRGWLNYYGSYYPSGLHRMLRCLNVALVAWAMRKYKSLHKRTIRAGKFMERMSRSKPKLFAHWERGMFGSFA
jgi:RNA-directed DNA polymerase